MAFSLSLVWRSLSSASTLSAAPRAGQSKWRQNKLRGFTRQMKDGVGFNLTDKKNDFPTVVLTDGVAEVELNVLENA